MGASYRLRRAEQFVADSTMPVALMDTPGTELSIPPNSLFTINGTPPVSR